MAEPEDEPTGLMCFMDITRMCGPDCMAYTPNPQRSQRSELNTQSSHCTILLNMERIGRNLGQIASDNRKSEEDKKRTGQLNPNAATHVAATVIPNPFGGKP